MSSSVAVADRGVYAKARLFLVGSLALTMAGIDKLKGVLLYGVARPSMQPEAPHVSPLSQQALEAYGALIKEKGLTVTVSP